MNKYIFLFLATLSLSACFSLTSSQEPPVTYAIHAAPHPDQTGPAIKAVVISVSEPDLPTGLETDKIALYMAGGRRLDYYSGARWPGTLGEVLQDLVVETGRFAIPGAIFDGGDLRIPAEYKLVMSVIDFAPFYQKGPEEIPLLKIAVNFTLMRLPENVVLARFTQKSEKVASANSLSAVTSGLESLLHAILADCFGRIAETIDSGEVDH